MAKNKQQQELKHWTVMVYLAGDNNLSDECVWSLKEMYRAFSNSKEIALVVQIDPRASAIRRFDIGEDLDELVSRGANAARSNTDTANLYLTQASDSRRPVTNDIDGLLSRRDSAVLEVVPPRKTPRYNSGFAKTNGSRKRVESMASPHVLEEFINHCKKTHPANHYLLILSGHGGSALGRSFLIDEFPPRGLSMAEVNQALKNAGGKIDVLGMDSCGMGMVEVGYELREAGEYLVASEGFEMNTGWPYHRVVEVLNRDPKIEPRALAVKIVEAHTLYYLDYIMGGVSTDIAACELKKSIDLAYAVGQLANVLRKGLPKDKRGKSKNEDQAYVEDMAPSDRGIADAVILAHWRAQSYRFEAHTDLYDFCDLLEKACSCDDEVAMKLKARFQEVVDACQRVKQAIKGTKQADGTYDAYVIKSWHSGGAFQYSNGVSIYFPWATVLKKEYNMLTFSRETSWRRFLEDFVSKTRRRPRPGKGQLLPVADDSSTVVRDSPELSRRDSPELSRRDSPELSRRGKSMIPQVKNPPDAFYEG